MDGIGNEVGQKMRSAIKAKLNELGCYVDDELPDYVMVMVANKRSRTQMEDDLQLFLGSKTEVFVHWLHQVLQKLQEVKIPPINAVTEPVKRHLVEEPEVPVKKEKKEKKRKLDKKSKKEESSSKKLAKINKKNLQNVSDLLPTSRVPLAIPTSSVTDIFANQLLLNAQITSEIAEGVVKNEVQAKPVVEPLPKKIVLNRDTILLAKHDADKAASDTPKSDAFDIPTISEIELQNTELCKTNQKELIELNEIEAKIELAKKRLENMNSDSDDDFLNINDGEELLDIDDLKAIVPTLSPDLNVLNKVSNTPPRKPVLERLGEKYVNKVAPTLQTREVNITNNLQPEPPKSTSVHSRLGNRPVLNRDSILGRMSSKIIALPPKRVSEEKELNVSVSSVVKVKPRPQIPASQQANKNLLLKAMADAQKSISAVLPRMDRSRPSELFTKKYREMSKNGKIGVTLPMRRNNMRITVTSNDTGADNGSSDIEYVPEPISDSFGESEIEEVQEYIPSSIGHTEESDTDMDQFEITKIANELISKPNKTDATASSNPQFVVTLDGLNPKAFGSRKHKVEPALVKKSPEKVEHPEEKPPLVEKKVRKHTPIVFDKFDENETHEKLNVSDRSIDKDSDNDNVNVVINKGNTNISAKDMNSSKSGDKSINIRDSENKFNHLQSSLSSEVSKSKIRERCKFFPNCKLGKTCEFSHPISMPCKTFPACKWGASCLYTHPQCKFSSECSKRDCPFSHAGSAAAPISTGVSSSVVPVQNYKSISTAPLPTMCRFYPQCSNPLCTFYHPKPCRFGKYCHNKVECNFYHHELPSKDKLTWRPTLQQV